MKKLIFISVAAMAMIFSSCGKKSKDAATTPETTPVEQAAPEASETPAVTESAAFTAAQTKLTEIQKQVEAATTLAELTPAADAVKAFRAEMATIAATLSEEENTTITELFKNVVEAAQKKEAELKKK